MEYIDWLNSTEKQISEMNFDQAVEIVENFMKPKEGKGYMAGSKPLTLRPHIQRALEIVLDRARSSSE